MFISLPLIINPMKPNLKNFAIFMLTSAALLLSACEPLTALPTDTLLYTPAQSALYCADCDQATLSVALTQQKQSADSQAAATAIIERAQAQAILNSANATLSAAQAQQQNNANILAAQAAATAEAVRANAQATVNSAYATQAAAQTQSQFNLQITQVAGTQSVFAAGTQTAISDNIATQTQVAAATAQWYADQDRQREEQRQAPIAFLWMWCLPVFIVLLAGLALWGVWRALKIQQANQRILEKPEIAQPRDDVQPYLESDVIDSHFQIAEQDEQVHQWIDEVKEQLLGDDKKDEDHDSSH